MKTRTGFPLSKVPLKGLSQALRRFLKSLRKENPTGTLPSPVMNYTPNQLWIWLLIKNFTGRHERALFQKSFGLFDQRQTGEPRKSEEALWQTLLGWFSWQWKGLLKKINTRFFHQALIPTYVCKQSKSDEISWNSMGFERHNLVEVTVVGSSFTYTWLSILLFFSTILVVMIVVV